jgi:hypothetical protein
MLVEIIETSVGGSWSLKQTDGVSHTVTMPIGVTPVEAKPTSKQSVKQVIALKEAGFTADEILEIMREIT